MLVIYNGSAFYLQVYLDQINEEAGPKVGESFINFNNVWEGLAWTFLTIFLLIIFVPKGRRKKKRFKLVTTVS